MACLFRAPSLAIATAAIAAATFAGELPAHAASAERGRELFAAAGGCGCHTLAGGPVGAGGKKIETPFGTFYGTNITPDPETGIGAWTDQEIDAAIRGGVLRGGAAEAPVMPYYWYSGMSDEDAADLIAYLRTLPAVRRRNRPHENELPLARQAYRAWAWLLAEPAVPAASTPTEGVERGRYLAENVSLCADCHTPRTWLGAVDRSLYMAGTSDGPGGEDIPNITPHATGIADWDEADIAAVLELGMLPDFDNVQGSMAEVVDGVGGGPGYKDMSDADRRAIAAYVRSVAPIGHEVED
ncbi:MAG TPA: cytochrome c [Candidatus Limnocylindrales bacterium]|nr:cytochrome c [Candidatus Limnocylindrales bacterium]